MIGQTLGHYRIDAKLGEGGMGVVYKAFDTHLNRTVAIKVLPARAVSDPARRRRFIQEARAASELDHPNIVTIYDIAEADGQLFIVMQFVAGKTLRELLARGRLPLDDVLRYSVQIADGLTRAHGRGIVHRDLKPANLMVTEEGQVKLLDFGLAKLTEAQPGEASDETLTEQPAPATEQGTLLGTPAYMSPEQAQGKKVDARSDIFSFGSLLYEMVTGRQAFKGDDRLSVLSAIVRDEPQKVSALAPSVPAELEKLIARALRKDRERRWQSMADLRVALTEMQEDTDSRPEAPMEPPSRRWPSLWIGAAIILALVILALVIRSPVWLRSDRPKTEPPAPAPKTVPFTSFPGQELKPAFSPDGNQLAFMWNGETSGNFDIYVKLIGAGAPLRLTTNPAEDFGPNWSPDGRYIAFYRQTAGGAGIFMVPALRGPERKLGQSAASFEFASPLAWSSDGKSLAIEDQNSPQEPRAIFLLSTETREKRRLTSPPAQYFDRFPAFSPDGQSLAFIRFRSLGVGDIYVLPVAGGHPPRGEPRRLTFDERGIWGLDWTPDGRSIVFSTNRAGDRSLWRISATASSSSGVPERLPAGGENAYSPSVSRQGHRLAYEHYGSDLNIWRIEVPSSTRRSSTGKVSPPTKLIASTRNDRNPQFSPDGKKIVFVSLGSGSDEIWMCDSEGTNHVQLTSFGGPPVRSPRWAPDGQRIAFESAKEGHGDIYLVSAEGGAPHRLTTEPSNDVWPSWSKDGRWIYFGSDRSAAWQVWKAPAQGGRAVQVTKKGGREAFESPDGKFVYYAKPDALGLWRVPVEGGEETQVLDQGDQGFWALLDRGIYFLNPKATRPVIEFFSFATRRLTEIAVVPKEANTVGGGYGFAVSTDGRWILYVQVDHTESDIVLVENFR